MKKYKHLPFLILLFIAAFFVRTYKLDNPIADWHSWRQADTASVTRNFIKQGFTPLFPKFDSLSALNDYADQNTNRYFFAEFPIYNILVYPLYQHFGVNPIYHRLVSIFFSSLSVIVFFYLVKLFSPTPVAYLSAIIFAFLPFNIYYGRVTMPDPLHIFFSLCGLLLINLWLKHQKLYLAILSGLLLALTILTKPYGLVLALPIGLSVLYQYFYKKNINWLLIILTALISVIPYLFWKKHIDQYPEGQFATSWLYNSTNIRFRPAFFRWIFYERFANLILGGGGFVLLFFGFISPKSKKESVFYYSWLVSLLIFVSIIATGNVTHDYYQLPFIPIFSVFVAYGIYHLIKIGKGFFQKIFNIFLATTLAAMMFFMAWYNVKGFFNINNWPIVEAGQYVDQNLPSNALVIAPYNNDPAFLYQTNRYGWTHQVYDIDNLITKYDQPIYLVSTTKDDYTNKILETGELVKETADFIVIKIND